MPQDQPHSHNRKEDCDPPSGLHNRSQLALRSDIVPPRRRSKDRGHDKEEQANKKRYSHRGQCINTLDLVEMSRESTAWLMYP